MRSKLAVVVPAYNEAHTIERTLDALHGQTETPAHIIVVNNASTDDTPNIVHDRYPGTLLVHERAKGTGYAANTGFRTAIELGARLIMRTNADSVPSRHWVATGNDYMQTHPGKQAISGRILPLRDRHWRFYDEFGLPAAYGGYRAMVSVLNRSPWPLRVLRGANMAMRADAFMK